MKLLDFIIYEPIKFAVCRNDVLYIVTEVRSYKVDFDKELELEEIVLPFVPTTWASGEYEMLLYKPDAGISVFHNKVLLHTWVGEGKFAAPYGVPFVNMEPLLGSTVYERRKYLKETNGFVWAYRNVDKTEWANPHFYMEGKLPIIGADPTEHFVVQGVASEFVVRHRTKAPLVYAPPPRIAIPYSLGISMLIGCEDGYCFTPNYGESWLRRKLNGFGFVAKNILMYVNNTGIYAVHSGGRR